MIMGKHPSEGEYLGITSTHTMMQLLSKQGDPQGMMTVGSI